MLYKQSEIKQLDVEQLSHILRSDYLDVNDELLVFNLIIQYVEIQPQESHEIFLLYLLKCVRLGLIGKGFLDRVIQSTDLIQSSSACKKFVTQLECLAYSQSSSDRPCICVPRLSRATMFCFGGRKENIPSNEVLAYDVRENSWTQVNVNPGLKPREFHSVCSVGHYLYTFGGMSSDEYLNSVEVLCCETLDSEVLSPMNKRRAYLGAATVGNAIYAIGGFDGENSLDSIEKYDIPRNQWMLLTPMLQKRSDCCAKAFQSKIFVCGGFDGEQYLSSCEFYDEVSNSWTRLPKMLYPRAGCKSVVFQDNLHVIGGVNGTKVLCECEKYDTLSDSWLHVRSMHQGRSYFSSEVIENSILVFGGEGTESSLADVEKFCDKSLRWNSVPEMMHAVKGHESCVIYDLPNRMKILRADQKLVQDQ